MLHRILIAVIAALALPAGGPQTGDQVDGAQLKGIGFVARQLVGFTVDGDRRQATLVIGEGATSLTPAAVIDAGGGTIGQTSFQTDRSGAALLAADSTGRATLLYGPLGNLRRVAVPFALADHVAYTNGYAIVGRTANLHVYGPAGQSYDLRTPERDVTNGVDAAGGRFALGARNRVYVFNADGGRLVRTVRRYYDQYFALGPDGTVAVDGAAHGDLDHIALVDPSGGTRVLRAAGHVLGMIFDGAGHLLVDSQTDDGITQLETFDADAKRLGSARTPGKSDGHLTIASDGTQLAWLADGCLTIAPITGTRTRGCTGG